MKDKIKFYIAIAVSCVSLSVFVLVLVNALWYSPSDAMSVASNAKANTVQAIAPSSVNDPIRLLIPALNIDTNIQAVGITKKGDMATPNNFTDVGWYKYGAVPGEIGSSVIAGHVDDGLALPAVFNHLDDLKEGDDVYVKMQNNETLHYVVSGLALYAYNADASAVFNAAGNRYLKLITCAGTWMPSYKTHDKRLVVTAVEI